MAPLIAGRGIAARLLFRLDEANPSSQNEIHHDTVEQMPEKVSPEPPRHDPVRGLSVNSSADDSVNEIRKATRLGSLHLTEAWSSTETPASNGRPEYDPTE